MPLFFLRYSSPCRRYGDHGLMLVIMVMVMGMVMRVRTFLIMMMMPVPMIMSMTITFMLGVVSCLISSPWHR